MTLPASGALSLGDVNVELGFSRTAQISLGGTDARGLYGIASGDIRLAADGYGKASVASGGLWTWGRGLNGRLGLGNETSRSSPNQVGALTNWTATTIVSTYMAIIKTNGTLWTWGFNGNGQLGIGNPPTQTSSPAQVGALTNWKKQQTNARGDNSLHMVKTDGTLWGWGVNNVVGGGKLGDNTIIDRSSPVQIGALTNWSQATDGLQNAWAVKTDGTLWGLGGSGLYRGDSDQADRSSPVQIGVLTDWKSITCGSRHAAAIKTNGTLWTWGFNSTGELGIGDRVHRSSPVQVGALTDWKFVSCGTSNTIAVRTNGTLWTWGSGINGVLATAGPHRSSPLQVGALTNWNLITVGSAHAGSIKTDGTLWTWGTNGDGQLGSGTTTNRSSPVQVGALTTWKHIHAGESSTLGII